MKTLDEIRIARLWKPKTRYGIGSDRLSDPDKVSQEPLGQPDPQALGFPDRGLGLLKAADAVAEDRHPQVQLMSHHPGIAGDRTLTPATHPAQEGPLGQNRLMGVKVVQHLHPGADLQISGADFESHGTLPHGR
jgi:hypothetical protein